MCREFAVQARILKRFLEHLVCGLSVHHDSSVLVSKRKQRTGWSNRFVFLRVPVDKILDCHSAVGIHQHASEDLTTFGDTLVKKQFGDPATCAYAEHEESAVTMFKGSVEAGGNESAFFVVKRSCAFHGFRAISPPYLHLLPSGLHEIMLLCGLQRNPRNHQLAERRQR